MAVRLGRVPSVAVELLRALVVVFGAGLGYELGARLIGRDADEVVGPFNGAWIGVIVGAGLGYSLGGVLARRLVAAIDRGDRALDALSAEQVVAGGAGALVVAGLVSLVAWPVLLLGQLRLTVPLFLFLVAAGLLFGFRAGARRRDAVLSAVGPRAGMGRRQGAPGSRVKVVDTSVAVDGRVLDVVRAGFLHGRLVVAAPVVGELQAMADSADDLRRGKGRRGLDVLEALRHETGVEVEVVGDEAPGVAEVDAKLVRVCLDRGAALLTFDTNLARAAAIAGVLVLNMHALALALRPPVVVGDEVDLALTRPGKEHGQAVGYLDDGTMVVVEGARDRVGSDARVAVTSVLTTANGRMVFARPARAAARRHDPAEVAARRAGL